MTDGDRIVLRMRLGSRDAHYGGGLVDGAGLLALFGDAATALCIAEAGDEGLFAGYDGVTFLAPVHAGDFIEVEAAIVRRGTRSRGMTFEARKIVAARPDRSPSAAEMLAEPIVVCRATGTCVLPKPSAEDAAQ